MGLLTFVFPGSHSLLRGGKVTKRGGGRGPLDLHHRPHPHPHRVSHSPSCRARSLAGWAHLSVGADNDLSKMVVHRRHGLTDGVQGRIHLLLHMVAVGEQLDHLHHHLGPEEGWVDGKPGGSSDLHPQAWGSKGVWYCSGYTSAFFSFICKIL